MKSAFDKIKEVAQTRDLSEYKTSFHAAEFANAVAVLTVFNRYIIQMYDTLWVENERGVGWVTCVDETAIRVHYICGPALGDYEWIQAIDFHGNSDASERTFVEQPLNWLKSKITTTKEILP